MAPTEVKKKLKASGSDSLSGAWWETLIIQLHLAPNGYDDDDD